MGQQFAILLNQIIQLGQMKNQDVEMALKQLSKFDFEPNDSYITKLYMDLLKQLQIDDKTKYSEILVTLSIYHQKSGKQNKWVNHLVNKSLENMDSLSYQQMNYLLDATFQLGRSDVVDPVLQEIVKR